ncbi:cytochrome P450 2C15-like isoform X2 [Hyla sarda]|uniref:cytochrome P450 2C15-like isoform X2 n=1 Tax=Hyla sarda TaxID=327740 RepID=UPI0024C46BE9|nr:cytochrome P450 2C15-like isoform X2 [Hyla sarda]
MEIAWLGTLVLLFTIFCLFIYPIWSSTHSNLPPGPRPIPIFGNVLQIKRGEMIKSLMEPVVMLYGYEAVKEALVDHAEEFGNRGNLPTVDEFIGGVGVGFSNGETWKQLRRFSFITLKNFGMGKRSLEERIQEEAVCLVAELKCLKGKPIDPTRILGQCASNVICSIVFGDRFEYHDENFHVLLRLLNAMSRDMSGGWGQLQAMLPAIMKYIPGPHQRITQHLTRLMEFVSERVKRNKESLDPNSPRDFIDCFLIRQQEEKENPSFNTENMLMTILDLFVAGTETVSTTLRHGFLVLLKYTDIQDKLQEEIDTVIGENPFPNVKHRSKMPYTDAVIHEIQRFCDVAPLSLPHAVKRDTEFRGFTIPKGMDVYPMLCSVHRDAKQFATPNRFNPNHFLDIDGNFTKNEAFMAFSAGKRACIGEGLARMELFIFITVILQNFRLSSKETFSEEDIAPKMNGFGTQPTQYQVSFIPR